MEYLLLGNSLIILFWIIITFMLDTNKSSYIVVIMTYILTFIVNYNDVVQTIPSLLICILSLFIYLELFIDNFKRKILTSLIKKALDFIFLIFSEYYFHLFLLTLFFSSTYFDKLVSKYLSLNYSYICLILGLIFLGLSCKNTANERFKVDTFTNMKRKIDNVLPYREYLNGNYEIIDKGCITYIEDKSYFFRNNSYTYLSLYYFKCKYIKKIYHFFTRFLSSSDRKKEVKRVMRGYSTIEMQIIRTIGVLEGYDEHIFRRKIFEFLYSYLFLKSLKNYYADCDCDISKYKDYLLYIYINIAPVLIRGGRKGLEKKYNKKIKKDISSFNSEELFLLILTFSGKIKWSNVIELYDNVIEELSLNKKELKRLRKKLLDNQ